MTGLQMRLTIFLIFCISLSTTVYAAKDEKWSSHKLDVDAFGPVKIGMTRSQASFALGVPLLFMPVGDSEPDLACDYIYPHGNHFGLGFMVENGHITRIDVHDLKFETVDGISIGDKEEKVFNVFKDRVDEEIHPYIGKEGKYLVIVKNDFGWVFETDRGIITKFRSGKLESIRYIEGCL
jgi:hypothetical protein